MTAVEVDALVVGAGFNGLYQLYQLRERGFSVQLVEASGGLGGVWHTNCYPGARVDSHVPNYEYSIGSVWRDWNWSERFPGRDELRRYFDHVADVLDLRPDIRLDTRVTAARFEESDRRWHVDTDRGDAINARFLIMCTGFASKPFIPEIPGLHDFEGERHHTAAWPQDGCPLAGRRVAVIGTGASGVQVVQEAAKQSATVTVFQRTPVTAIPMGQHRFTPEEQSSLKANYAALFRERNAPPGSLTEIRRIDVSALDVTPEERERVFRAAWERGGFHFWVGTFNDTLTNLEANRLAYEFWRDRTRERIDDPAVAELLAPTGPPYPFGTKRPSLEQDYYDAFNLPHVELVDVRATPIERVTATGIRTSDGTHREFDLIVLATGFDANTGGLTQIDLRDSSGSTLKERWAEGVDTHLGMAIAGFANLLMLYGPQSSTAFCNGPTCAELQGDWVVDLLVHLRDRGLTRIEATAEAAARWSAHLDDVAAATLFPLADSWYMAANVPGKRRQLLNHPISDVYLTRIAESAADGYSGFTLE
jgi:cation diffusion facilitator CzcD-associated flavoprotein CzcO